MATICRMAAVSVTALQNKSGVAARTPPLPLDPRRRPDNYPFQPPATIGLPRNWLRSALYPTATAIASPVAALLTLCHPSLRVPRIPRAILGSVASPHPHGEFYLSRPVEKIPKTHQRPAAASCLSARNRCDRLTRGVSMRPSGFFCVAVIVVFNAVAVEPSRAQISSASIRASRTRRKAITAPSPIAYEFDTAATTGK